MELCPLRLIQILPGMPRVALTVFLCRLPRWKPRRKCLQSLLATGEILLDSCVERPTYRQTICGAKSNFFTLATQFKWRRCDLVLCTSNDSRSCWKYCHMHWSFQYSSLCIKCTQSGNRTLNIDWRYWLVPTLSALLPLKVQFVRISNIPICVNIYISDECFNF